MGHVFRAWDARLHREVAVKLLNHDYTMPGMRERFLREARAASALNHPNICTIFDIGEQDGDPYLVMELLQGETLKDRILGQPIPIPEIAQIARETAEALGAAHAKGVIHRDVKPANIFLVEKPNGGLQAKVLDFGLAKIEGGVLGSRARTLDITTVGATVGTLAYMSPEQARGESLDSRSDLFSLGVVLYEMATRHVPFQGATSALVFVQLLNHPPEPVREWNESVPRELEKIIFKLLAKDRAARFQTAHELEAALLGLDKGNSGGGWLRKAVTAVPLVRAQDPVARERRGRTRHSSSAPAGAGSAPGSAPAREGQRDSPHSDAPSPDTGRFEGRAAEPRTDPPVPPGREALPTASNDVLRPVARVPREDATPARPRAGIAPEVNATSLEAGAALPGASASLEPPVVLAGSATRVPAVEVVEFLPASEPAAAAAPAVQERAPGAPARSSGGLSSGDFRAKSRADLVQEEKGTLTLAGVVPDPAHDDMFPPLFAPSEPGAEAARGHRRLLFAGVAAILLAAGVIAGARLMVHGQFGPTVLQPGDVIVVAQFENKTGNKVLDGSVAEGLRLGLIQSPWLTLRGDAAWNTASLLLASEAKAQGQPAPAGAMLARRAAERLGARAYLYGNVSGASPFQISAELLDVSSNNILATAQESAPSLEQVPAALDRLASDLRIASGESRNSIEASAAPLSRDASANLEALSAYGDAQQFFAAGRLLEALDATARATAADPHFVQAHLRRAAIFEQLHAELAAAEAARLALADSDHASARTRALAQAAFALNSSDDLPRASSILRQLLASYPHDTDAQTAMARALRLEGRFGDALSAAQQGYADDSINPEAYAEAESALLAMNRFDAAFRLDQQMQHLGLPPSGQSILTAYLDGNAVALPRLVDRTIHDRAEGSTFAAAWEYGVYLDNAGRLSSAAEIERSVSEAEVRSGESLASAASALLAQSALDRALLGDCGMGLSLADKAGALPEGREALIRSGIARGLCGQAARAGEDLAVLTGRYPNSFSLASFAAADIKAAIAIHDQDPDTALAALRVARNADLISVTPYLRGLAHTQLQQAEIGIVDYQTVLSHRGSSLLSGGTVYPAAQAGVARAFAQSGDLSNSADAWRRFLVLWQTAEPGSPLLQEARAHAK